MDSWLERTQIEPREKGVDVTIARALGPGEVHIFVPDKVLAWLRGMEEGEWIDPPEPSPVDDWFAVESAVRDLYAYAVLDWRRIDRTVDEGPAEFTPGRNWEGFMELIGVGA